MGDLIIILGNEPEIVRLAMSVNQRYCNNKGTILMYNDLDFHEHIGNYSRVFLLGHADAQSIGDYDYSSLTKGEFRSLLANQSVNSIFLAGCSTADEAQQILKDGFVPLNLAQNLAKFYTGAQVYGTPGVLVRKADGTLNVIQPSLAAGYPPGTIFVHA